MDWETEFVEKAKLVKVVLTCRLPLYVELLYLSIESHIQVLRNMVLLPSELLRIQ